VGSEADRILKKEKETIMKRKEILSALFLAAAMMTVNTGPVSAQSTGGSQSERSGTDSQTPLPPKSPSSGSEGDASKTGKMPSAQSKPTGKAKDDKSIGGSQSERSGTDTQTPLPPKSPSSGSGDETKGNKNPGKQSNKSKDDKSIGGSQSERSGTDTQTPLPPGSGSSGSGK
jgi:hypothetical protein